LFHGAGSAELSGDVGRCFRDDKEFNVESSTREIVILAHLSRMNSGSSARENVIPLAFSRVAPELIAKAVYIHCFIKKVRHGLNLDLDWRF
jgi:hypothetical protein